MMNARSRNHSGARSILTAVVALWLCAGPACEDSSSRQSSKDRRGGKQYDDGYIAALGAADEFCHAWQKGQLQDAKALMSRRLIRQHPDQRIADAIVSVSNPVHVGYEIFQGERLRDKRIAFQVRLFRRYVGEQGDRIEGPLERVVMVRGEDGRWRVDEFPMLARN